METLIIVGICVFVTAFIIGGIAGTLWMNSYFDSNYYGVRKADFPQEIQDKVTSNEYALSIVVIKNPKHNAKPKLTVVKEPKDD